MINTPNELSAALQKTRCQVRVTKSLYWHFLEVLPPRAMGSNFFIFQEGDGERLHFTCYGDSYYCHLLGDYLVTEDWKIHTAVSRHDVSQPFKVLFIFTDSETCDTPEEYQDFVGKEFFTISELADAMKVSFRV